MSSEETKKGEISKSLASACTNSWLFRDRDDNHPRMMILSSQVDVSQSRDFLVWCQDIPKTHEIKQL